MHLRGRKSFFPYIPCAKLDLALKGFLLLADNGDKVKKKVAMRKQ